MKMQQKQKAFPPSITQDELAEFLELRKQKKRCEELRQSILDRLDAGADIEPGELAPVVETKHSVTLTWEVLTELLGAKRAQKLRTLIEPRSHRHLYVVPCDEDTGVAG